MSLKSLIDNPKELLELINDCLKPKQEEKKKFGEVFTPIEFINNNMLKDLKKYDNEIFKNKNLTWFDPCAGMGNFPIAIYLKLMKGLEDEIPNKIKRKKHIIENMLYMGELNKKNCFVIKKIFNIDNKLKLNLYEGDTLELDIKKVFGIKKFDIIIGNPPYNQELKSTGALPLYNKFIEYYIDKCTYLSFVVPSRWFSGGKNLDKFRKFMLNRTDLVYINHIDNASSIFGSNVNIKGGINYFLKDKNYNDLCMYNNNLTKLNKYDIFVENKYYKIIDKLIKYNSITSIYLGRYFGIETNDKHLTDNNKLIKCYVSKQKGFIKYINKKYIKKEYNFYKIIMSRASYTHKSGFGNIFIGNKKEIHTSSYISFKINTKEEADSLLSYLKCKLPNFLLSIRKNSQDISETTCKWIPLPVLDRIWTNKKIYKYFKLSEEDIELIENSKINGYKE